MSGYGIAKVCIEQSYFAFGEEALWCIAIRRGIEVVITGLTRNQFVSNHTRVRIPPDIFTRMT